MEMVKGVALTKVGVEMYFSKSHVFILSILCVIGLGSCDSNSESTNQGDIQQPITQSVDDPNSDASENQGDTANDDIDSGAVGDNTTIIGNRPVSVLVMEGQALQSPAGRELVVLRDFDLNDDGKYAFTGIYQGVGQQIGGVWSGTLGEVPNILVEDGSAVFSGSVVQRFSGAAGVHVGSIGEITIGVTLSGDPPIPSLAIMEPGSESFSVLVSSGDTVSGYNGPQVLGAIMARDFSDSGVAFVSSTEVDSSFLYGLWTLQDGEVKAVAPGRASGESNGPTYPGKDCLLYYAGTNAFAITDDGDVIFEAVNSAPTNTGICPNQSIIRFDGEQYTEVVATQSLVPGAQRSGFRVLELSGVTRDGAVLVNAVIQNPEPARNRVWSHWHFPKVGIPDLLMIDAESVEGGDTSASLTTRFASVRVGTDFRFAAKAQLGDTDALLYGPHREGQPHTDLDMPGAAEMRLVAVSDEQVLIQDSGASVYEEVDEPELPISGGMVFTAEVTLPGSILPERVLWSFMENGSIERLLAASDLLQYNGTSVPVGKAEFSQSQSRFFSTTGNDIVIEAFDRGDRRLVHLPLTP